MSDHPSHFLFHTFSTSTIHLLFTFRSHLLHADLTLLLVFNKHDLPYCVLLCRHVIVHPIAQWLMATRLTAINTTHPFRLWDLRVSTPDLVKMDPCMRLLRGQEGTALFQGKVSHAQENQRNTITFSSQPLCPSGMSAVLPSSAHPRSSSHHHHPETSLVHRPVLLAKNCLLPLIRLMAQTQTIKNPLKTTFS